MPMAPMPRLTSASVITCRVTCTVVSVLPYMFTSCGWATPCRRTHGRSIAGFSASPPKITYRRDSPLPESGVAESAATSAPITEENADGVWLSTVTCSESSSRRNSSGDRLTSGGTTTKRPP